MRITKSMVSKWLDTESKKGNFLMDGEGTVTRREVILMHTIILFVLGGATAIEDSIWLSALFFIAASLAVKRLNRIDKTKQSWQQKNSTKSTSD